MEKHANVPAAATWNADHNIWTLGEQNSEGKNIGIWQSWHIAGHLCETIDYNDGTPPFQVKGFHPDGTISVESTWYGGSLWKGTYRYIKSENPTTEGFPNGGPNAHPNVWIAEYDYTEEEGVFNAQRYYDKQHQPVSWSGIPLPKRPDNVPERAHMLNDGRWIMGQVSTRKGHFVGPYDEWDKNGIQLIKRIYDYETGQVVEEHEYSRGKLWRSKITGPGDQVLNNYYYDDTEPAVIEKSILAVNMSQDKKYSFFDKTGQLLYTIHEITKDGLHLKRTYNDTLIYELVPAADIKATPLSVRYFYPNGAVMISYQSNGDNTGYWQMYEVNGQVSLTMPVDNEEKHNRFHQYQHFLTFDFDSTTTGLEWERMIENFKWKYTQYRIDNLVATLPVPAFLQEELDKTNWKEIDVAMNGGKHLPKYINGVFAEDNEVAEQCLKDIWMQIQHQGSVYECTYVTGSIIAQYMPRYKSSPAIHNRLLDFMKDVMELPRIEKNKEQYAQLQALYQAAITDK